MGATTTPVQAFWRHAHHSTVCLITLLLVAAATKISNPGLAMQADHGARDEANEKAEFLQRYGHTYGYSGRIDELYKAEIAPRFAAEGAKTDQHYLDSTASQLYLTSQLKAIAQELGTGVFGNPHSANPSSIRSAQLMQEIERDLLQLFCTDPEQYTLVFTRSATGALRMIAEAFPWSRQSALLLSRANHNSVLGMREHACAAGARLGTSEPAEIESWLSRVENAVDDHDPLTASVLGVQGPRVHSWQTGAGWTWMTPCHGRVPQLLGNNRDTEEEEWGQGVGAGGHRSGQHSVGGVSSSDEGGAQVLEGAGQKEVAYSLLAYPAADNYHGELYSLDWVRRVHNIPDTPIAAGQPRHRWLVALDTAAFVPHHPLNLSQIQPDFAVMSFYKLFGIPSGVGALIVKKDAAKLLWPRYFGGGSIFTATAALRWHAFHQPPERLEPGSPAFLEIISLRSGLKALKGLGDIKAVRDHTESVADWLGRRLRSLTHSNGKRLVRLFGRWEDVIRGEVEAAVQGPTVNFLLLDEEGQVISYKAVGLAAAQAGIHVRWGCMCNPGSCYHSVGVLDGEIRAHAHDMAKSDPAGGEGWEEVWEWLTVNRTDPGSGATRTVTLPLGSIRASLGWMVRFEDAYALVQFVSRYRDTTARQVLETSQPLLEAARSLASITSTCGSG